MLPSQFFERMPPDPGVKPAPFEFELQVWLGHALVPSIAIQHAFAPKIAHQERRIRVGSADSDEPRPPRPPSLIATWRERVRYRRELARLMTACPHMLADIGFTWAAAEAEIARPFWRGSPERQYSPTSFARSAEDAVHPQKPRTAVG